MAEIIIVGAGAAGAAAALALARLGLRPLVLDVGHTHPGHPSRAEGNLYDLRRRRDTFDLFIGQDLAGLGNVLNATEGVAKLNAPHMRFVTRDAEVLGPLEQQRFDAVQSFALGGLGNAWGAGLYRFVDADLQGFPVRAAELAPYFDVLTREIGISGADDDLAPFFGSTSDLLPPLRLSHNAARVERRYLARRERLRSRGIHLGRPRLGVLSVPYGGRPACDYSNLEFWQDQPYLYTPAMTLRKLIGQGAVDYRPQMLVRSWQEMATGVTVTATDLHTGETIQVVGRALLLAAGAINSARLALQSAGDYRTVLPLLENPILLIPLVLPASLGRRLDAHTFGLVQLNLIWESAAHGSLLQGSLIELTAPLRAEFFGSFPLSARGNLALLRYLLPAMLLLQLYFPASVQLPARLSLQSDGRLRIEGQPHRMDLRTIGPLLAALRLLGLWTHRLLIQQPVTGHAIHYAGTLPMSAAPGPYQCGPDGRLHGWRRVFVADSACFSSLPAKNMSLGMMANAMRVAEAAARLGDGEP